MNDFVRSFYIIDGYDCDVIHVFIASLYAEPTCVLIYCRLYGVVFLST